MKSSRVMPADVAGKYAQKLVDLSKKRMANKKYNTSRVPKMSDMTNLKGKLRNQTTFSARNNVA